MEDIVEIWILGFAAMIALFFAIAALLWVYTNPIIGSIVLGIIFIPLLLGWLLKKWESR